MTDTADEHTAARRLGRDATPAEGSARARRFGDVVVGIGAACFALYGAFALRRDFTALGIAWGVAAALLLLTFRLRPTARVNVALGVLPLLLGLHGFELRMMWTKPPAATSAARAGRAWDNRAIAEVVDDYRHEGRAAVPYVQPKPLLLLHKAPLPIDGADAIPLGGISSAFTVYCNEGGAFTTYDADEHGFVNPRGLWGSPVELVMLGDSFTQGACVTPEESFAGRIRARHPSALNLGMGGNGPLLELAGLRELASRARPRHVLWFYFRNDLDDLNVEKAFPLLMRYLEPGFSRGLYERQGAVDAALRVLVAEQDPRSARWPAWLASAGLDRRRMPFWIQDLVMGEDHTAAAAVIRLDQLGNIAQSKGTEEAPDFALFESILRLAQAEVAAWGGALHFVYLPDMWYVGNKSKDHKNRNKTLEIVRAVGLPLVDVHARFIQAPDLEALRYGPSSHDSPAGYALIGRVVNEYLDGLAR